MRFVLTCNHSAIDLMKWCAEQQVELRIHPLTRDFQKFADPTDVWKWLTSGYHKFMRKTRTELISMSRIRASQAQERHESNPVEGDAKLGWKWELDGSDAQPKMILDYEQIYTIEEIISMLAAGRSFDQIYCELQKEPTRWIATSCRRVLDRDGQPTGRFAITHEWKDWTIDQINIASKLDLAQFETSAA